MIKTRSRKSLQFEEEHYRGKGKKEEDSSDGVSCGGWPITFVIMWSHVHPKLVIFNDGVNNVPH